MLSYIYTLHFFLNITPKIIISIFYIYQNSFRSASGSTAEPLSSAYAAQFGTAFAAAPLGSVLGSAAAAAAGKQVEGN